MSNLLRRPNSSINSKKDMYRPYSDNKVSQYVQESTAYQAASTAESIMVTVIPCGREDGQNCPEELPYELKIKKKSNHS